MIPLRLAAAFCFASHPSDSGDLGGTGGGVGVALGEDVGLASVAPATANPAEVAVVRVWRFSAAACAATDAGGS